MGHFSQARSDCFESWSLFYRLWTELSWYCWSSESSSTIGYQPKWQDSQCLSRPESEASSNRALTVVPKLKYTFSFVPSRFISGQFLRQWFWEPELLQVGTKPELLSGFEPLPTELLCVWPLLPGKQPLPRPLFAYSTGLSSFSWGSDWAATTGSGFISTCSSWLVQVVLQ